MVYLDVEVGQAESDAELKSKSSQVDQCLETLEPIEQRYFDQLVDHSS